MAQDVSDGFLKHLEKEIDEYERLKQKVSEVSQKHGFWATYSASVKKNNQYHRVKALLDPETCGPIVKKALNR